MSDKTFDMIIGRKTGLKQSIVVYVCVWYIFIAFIAFAIFDIVAMIFDDEILDIVAITGLTIFILIIFLYVNRKANIFKAINRKQTERICEEREKRFRALPPERQEEVVYIAECFQKSNKAGCDNNYVWGKLEKVKKSNSLWGGENRFECIPYTDIMWAHLLNIRLPIVTGNELVVSAREMCYIYVCIYTYNCECYRFKAGVEGFRTLRKKITLVNPNCKFGYTKEFKKEYEHLKRVRKEFK
jgi:hypothetical protein